MNHLDIKKEVLKTNLANKAHNYQSVINKILESLVEVQKKDELIAHIKTHQLRQTTLDGRAQLTGEKAKIEVCLVKFFPEMEIL